MYRFMCRRFADMDQAALERLGRFRHEVFIGKLRWDVASVHPKPGVEIDKFDAEGTIFIMALDSKGKLVGCTRLLPTTRPYLLGDVFPRLCEKPVPRDAKVWELSRYAAVSSVSGTLGISLFKASMQLAHTQGVRDVVAVTTQSLERYFLRHGVELCRLGGSFTRGKDRLVALCFSTGQFSNFTCGLSLENFFQGSLGKNLAIAL
ncbi:acyl-homoserine-lactone synthase [Pseudomonas vanderleydeniana]|uniref:Acyl-homoserine-lactone synthase n=1 Tax=Pseudomonas vanderleydeniana TaxID=2745495 RepID=A0A9E6PIN5_9PSED|nr:acyl-homoserine-lactone synthase [Pseudomonas vanderleydeniana]QXI26843.1 GNAT family N-acetyltransferase [Pseudomonas vanderleydeniana]